MRQSVRCGNSVICKNKYIATLVQPAPVLRVREVDVRPRPEYFPALTGLRFLLAIWVMLHHLVSKGMMLEAWSHTLPMMARVFLEQGHVAVRTFFVLSGFVLARGYANSRWTRRDIASYGIARLARVYPVYVVSLLLITGFVGEFLMRADVSSRAKFDAIAAYGLVLQGWMPNAGAGWNTPAWSLSCEFLFYLCLPLILIWLGERSRWRLAALLVTSLLVPVLLRRTMSLKPILHLGDFLVGIAVAQIYRRRWKGAGAWLYIPAIVATMATVLLPVSELGMLLRPLNGLLVLGFALGGGVIDRILSTGTAQFLGQASYSMYILHVPLLWWFGNRGPEPLRGLGAGIAIIYFAGVILVSAACFQWIEKPANRFIRAWASSRAGRSG